MATYTEAQLQALKDALANGALEVQHGDNRVRYRSVDELKAAIATVEAALNAASATKKTVRQVQVYTEKGF